MPAAAAGAVTGYASLTAAFAAGAAAAVGYAAIYVITAVAINYGLTRLSQALAGKQKLSGSTAVRDVTVRGTVEPMQMIYGEIAASGFMAQVAISGANNHYLHYVIALAAHQCEDIGDVWLDSRLVPDADIDGSGDVSTAEFQGEGQSRLNIQRYLGTKAQTADAEMAGAAIGDWTSNHRGAGVAYLHIRMDGSDEAFPGSAPSNIRAMVKGRRLYDPRLDSTNGGSGSHRYTDARTWAWSQNPALARRDYITGGSRWYDVATPEPRLGFGDDNARVNDTFTIAAANIDDENVVIPPSSSPVHRQKRYTCDVQLSCGDTHRENLKVLESASAGTTGYVNGQYRIYSGAYDTPEVDLVEDDILGPVTVVTHPNGEDLYNLVTGTFFDEDRDWQQVPFPNITNSSFETADGGQYARTIELHATRSTYRAQRIGILHLALSRNKFTVRFERLSPKAMAIAEHETFTVTISEYGWSSKVFRCLEWEWMPDGFIAITAREESSSHYADPSVGTYVAGSAGTVATPEYDEPATPVDFEARSMPAGILFRWNVQEPDNKDTLFRLYEHTAVTPFSSATEVWSGKTRTVTLERPGYDTNYYWLTAVLNGIESDPTPVSNGLAAAPGLQGFEDVFFDSFDHADYERFYNLRDGTPTVTYPANGDRGGTVLSASGYGWFASKYNIPFDASALYVMTVRARMTSAPTGGVSTQDKFWAGVEGIGADGTTLVNSVGANLHSSQHYFAASDFDMGGVTLGQWVEFRGYLAGHATTPSPFPAPDIADPAEAYTDGINSTIVRYIRPVFIVNYNGGNGSMEVDLVRLEKVVDTQRIAPNAATEVRTQTTAGPVVTGNVTNGTSTIDTLSFTAEFSGELVLTIGFDATKTSGAGSAFGTALILLNGGPTQFASSGSILDGTTRSFIARIIGSVSAGDAVDAILYSKHALGTSNATFSNIDIETEYIKK